MKRESTKKQNVHYINKQDFTDRNIDKLYITELNQNFEKKSIAYETEIRNLNRKIVMMQSKENQMDSKYQSELKKLN